MNKNRNTYDGVEILYHWNRREILLMMIIKIPIPAQRKTFDDDNRNTDSCPQMRGAEDAAHDTSCLWSTWKYLI